MSAEDGNKGSSKQSIARKYLEEEYLETEKKVNFFDNFLPWLLKLHMHF
jgi:hypothetical protein